MTSRGTLLAALLCATAITAGCVGPDAPDAALCRDVIHRLCIEPRCDEVTNGLAPKDDCEADLQARSGCDDVAFTFESPTRARFIDCRAVLVRGGVEPDAAPECGDVAATFTQCPELSDFFQEAE